MIPEPMTRATPSAAGVDAAGLLRFLDAIETHPEVRPRGLVVQRDGYVIAEGTWAPYPADHVSLLYSLSKSFTSTAAGLAHAEGLLDLDATVLSYFPELDRDITDSRNRAMRVRHLASMASGHASDTIDRAARLDATDLVRGFLLLPPDAEPGTLFAYNQPCTYTLAAIVQRQTGMTLVEYLRPRLLDPLGIGDVAWIEQPAGRNLGFSGLHATTAAVARLGELYRRGGLWGDRRILSEEWVELATRRHIPTPPVGAPDWEQGYGFQFWMARHGYRGDGAFGQFCVVVPEAGLVVAMTSETEPMQVVLDALWEHVLPAIGTAGDAEADAALAARLATLSHDPLSLRPDPDDVEHWTARAVGAAPGGAPVDTVRVARDGGTWRLGLDDAGGRLDLGFAAGRWIVDESAAVPVAATGGWTERGELVVDVLFLESPHSLLVTVAADGASATAGWRTTPLHDQTPSAQHRPR